MNVWNWRDLGVVLRATSIASFTGCWKDEDISLRNYDSRSSGVRDDGSNRNGRNLSRNDVRNTDSVSSCFLALSCRRRPPWRWRMMSRLGVALCLPKHPNHTLNTRRLKRSSRLFGRFPALRRRTRPRRNTAMDWVEAQHGLGRDETVDSVPLALSPQSSREHARGLRNDVAWNRLHSFETVELGGDRPGVLLELCRGSGPFHRPSRIAHVLWPSGRVRHVFASPFGRLRRDSLASRSHVAAQDYSASGLPGCCGRRRSTVVFVGPLLGPEKRTFPWGGEIRIWRHFSWSAFLAMAM